MEIDTFEFLDFVFFATFLVKMSVSTLLAALPRWADAGLAIALLHGKAKFVIKNRAGEKGCGI